LKTAGRYGILLSGEKLTSIRRAYAAIFIAEILVIYF